MMISDAVDKYTEMVESLDDSGLFILQKRKLFMSIYQIGTSPIFVEISVWQEAHLHIEWCIDYNYLGLDIHNEITGEEAFSSLPDKYKEDSIFHLDLFALKNGEET
jgi:hypothetical protein